jgi:membrane-bound inhibitor of C-type lysozyme
MEMLPMAAAAMMGGVDVSAQVVLQFSGNFERKVVEYHCETIEPITVDFINAEPNFIAILPLGGKKYMLSSVVAASGVKYVGGPFEFWVKGNEATLTDVTVDQGGALACAEASDTP